MAKEKKFYGVKELDGVIWKTELDAKAVMAIFHEGAGCEMCTDEIVIEFNNYTMITVDRIICE